MIHFPFHMHEFKYIETPSFIHILILCLVTVSLPSFNITGVVWPNTLFSFKYDWTLNIRWLWGMLPMPILLPKVCRGVLAPFSSPRAHHYTIITRPDQFFSSTWIKSLPPLPVFVPYLFPTLPNIPIQRWFLYFSKLSHPLPNFRPKLIGIF